MVVIAEKLFCSLFFLRHKAKGHGNTAMQACIEFEKKEEVHVVAATLAVTYT